MADKAVCRSFQLHFEAISEMSPRTSYAFQLLAPSMTELAVYEFYGECLYINKPLAMICASIYVFRLYSNSVLDSSSNPPRILSLA